MGLWSPAASRLTESRSIGPSSSMSLETSWEGGAPGGDIRTSVDFFLFFSSKNEFQWLHQGRWRGWTLSPTLGAKMSLAPAQDYQLYRPKWDED